MYTNTEDSQWRARRRYSAEFKQELVLLCRQPGMSVASVARRHGINHNIVHRWIREHAPCTTEVSADLAAVPGFTSVPLPVKAQGMDFVRAKVGDRYVLEALAQKGWTIGGEGSGHILVLDKHSTGDGLIAALQVLQAVVRSGQSLAQLLEGVILFPQTLVNVRVQPGTDWQQNKALQDGVAAAERTLLGRGRVLIRASGTEPLLRVMVEADDAALAEGLAKELAQLAIQ